jgi:hypothetical protein
MYLLKKIEGIFTIPPPGFCVSSKEQLFRFILNKITAYSVCPFSRFLEGSTAKAGVICHLLDSGNLKK